MAKKKVDLKEEKITKEDVKEEPKKKEEKKKVYKFNSAVKYLYIDGIGVQFKKGKYETEDKDIAERLKRYSNVEEE